MQRRIFLLSPANCSGKRAHLLKRAEGVFPLALRLRSAEGEPRFGEEFAGSTFSPDGHTLFVNIQAGAGLTFAIWGPWEEIGV